jgi:outer membrane protein assembly factor BamC
MQRMDVAKLSAPLRAAALVAAAALFVSGCESGKSMGKKIDYKSVSTTPALEIPPDLTTPQYDDRYNTATASGIAAQTAMKPKSEGIAVNNSGDARIVKSGNERWLVVKIAPEQAWNITRQFWLDNGFVLALEQPAVGVMETDWAENRAEIPEDFVRRQLGKFADVLYTTYKRDKFRTRIERGSEAGTVELFVSSRRMEQVPTAKIDNSSPTAFAWALMPPDPQVDAAMPEAVAEL